MNEVGMNDDDVELPHKSKQLQWFLYETAAVRYKMTNCVYVCVRLFLIKTTKRKSKGFCVGDVVRRRQSILGIMGF